jgi:hypothetical protein
LLSGVVTRFKSETRSSKVYTPYIVELSEQEILGFNVRTQDEFVEITGLNRIVLSSCLQGVQLGERADPDIVLAHLQNMHASSLEMLSEMMLDCIEPDLVELCDAS